MDELVALSHALLWLVVVAQGLLLLGLLRTVVAHQHGRPAPFAPVQGLPIGTGAPIVSGSTLAGSWVDSSEWLGTRSSFLFVSPDCDSCRMTPLELEALRSKVDNLVVVCRGSDADCLHFAEEQGLESPMLADSDLSVSERFAVTAVPTAVLIDETGRISRYGHPERDQALARVVEQQAR